MNNPAPSAAPSTDYDVLVIGGGPGGSCVASLLAKRGWRVGLVEKDVHPRFHIGESLLPMNMPILKKLGVYDAVAAIGIKKNGVDFHTKDAIDAPDLRIHFKDSLTGDPPAAFQVLRSQFDHILIENSAKLGVDVMQGQQVRDIDFSNLQKIIVKIQSGQGQDLGSEIEKSARFIVDASGRDTFLSKKMKLKTRSARHNDAAIFAHFKDVDRRQDANAGNIGLHWFDHGWIWRIPLANGMTSIGAVSKPEYLKSCRGDNTATLLQIIKDCPSLAHKMTRASLAGKVQGTGNYSYQSSSSHGARFIMIGDAFAFVDPVFSSGVYIAMNAAERALPVIEAHLSGVGDIAQLQKKFDQQTRLGLSRFTWFIYRYTSPGLMRLFVSGQDLTQIKRAVISVLAGDVYDNPAVNRPLRFFKLLYLLFSIRTLSATISHFKGRKRDLSIKIEKQK